MSDNLLCYGDNLALMRDRDLFPDESVDLVYLDPPFNSNATYNQLFSEPTGRKSEAQGRAFEDTWHWEHAKDAFYEILETAGKDVRITIKSMYSILGPENDMMAYLVMMAPRLVELCRVLKPTGSIYLHCDPTASHYLKIIMDAVFSARNFQNEIIWKRTSGHSDARRFGRTHDTILFYSRENKTMKWNGVYKPYDEDYIKRYYRYVDADGRRFQSGDLSAAGGAETPRKFGDKILSPPPGNHWRFSQANIDKLIANDGIYWTKNGYPRLKRYLDEAKGLKATDLWTGIEALRSWHQERLGYPTQKPESLLERIIEAVTDEGDTVLDPFCGCGTTIAAAQKLNRRWIGIDITHLAITLIKQRLKDTHGEKATYQTAGEPEDIAGARELAALDDKYQFQWWVVGKITGRVVEKKKGSDKGVDGVLYFRDPPDGPDVKEIVISVKAGKTGPAHVRELSGTINHRDADMGVFVCLDKPTPKMIAAASEEGIYKSEYWGETYPKLQILCVEDIMEGKRIAYPKTAENITLKKAPKAKVKKVDNPQMI